MQAAAQLIEHAENMAFTDFRLVARRWESLNDTTAPTTATKPPSRSPGVNLADG